MSHTGTDAAEQIENKIPDMPQHILHIVSKNPEKEHVPDKMEPPSVEKERGKERKKGWNRIKIIIGQQEKKFVRDDTEVKDESFKVGAER